MSERRLVRVRTFALMTDTSERTLYDQIGKGRLPAYRVSPRSIRVDVDEALAALRDERAGKPCVVCGAPAESSLIGTASCSAACTGQLADQLLPRLAADLLTRSDGSGGSPPRRSTSGTEAS